MAIDYFKKAIKNDSDEMDYKVNLAVALYRMYMYDQAMIYYEEVKKAKPELVSQLDFIDIIVLMKNIFFIITLILLFCPIFAQDEDLDLDAMWDNTVWNEIEDVADAGYEVEKVTAVAGVRGAEAEDEALHHLYYRQSMKGPSKVELNKALGKLLNTLSSLKEKNPEHAKIPEVTHYVIQIYKKLEQGDKAKGFEKELLAIAPDSKWAKFYK